MDTLATQSRGTLPKPVTKSNKKQQSRTGNNQFAFSKKQKK
jgi:hypothetical protein